MIFVIATVHVRAEQRADFLENVRSVVAASLKEPACRSYDVHSSITEPNCFVFVERWDTREALSAHFDTPHFKEWQRVSAPFVEKAVVEVVAPAAVETL